MSAIVAQAVSGSYVAKIDGYPIIRGTTAVDS